MRALFVCVLAVAVGSPLIFAPLADAQSANEVAAARRLYRQGVRHARAQRWPQALEAFEQSVALAERPATLLNMAGALVETGRMVEGAEAYRRYLQADVGGRHAESARAQLQELEGRMPKIVLRVDGLSDDDDLSLDGEELGRGVLGVELPVDPGDHEVLVTRDGDAVGEERFSVEERETKEVSLRVPPPSPSIDLTTTAQSESDDGDDDSGGVLSSPVFWVVVGALVIGGVAGGVLLTSGDSGPDAFGGNVGSGRVGL